MKSRVLITGAASGLAAGIAEHLALDGFKHVATTFRTTPPDETLTRIEATGVSASATRIDFSADEAAVVGAMEALVERHGPFDTLVHSVGPLVVKRFARMTLDDYREMFDGNVRSAIIAARAVLPAMREAKYGRIVFFGMNGSSETRPYRGFTLHQAAKSAVVAFARSLAIEEAEDGITVNVIEPGYIRDKDATRDDVRSLPGKAPRGRPGSFEDVADVVHFLVAPERDFITGTVIGVTGGLMEADERNASR